MRIGPPLQGDEAACLPEARSAQAPGELLDRVTEWFRAASAEHPLAGIRRCRDGAGRLAWTFGFGRARSPALFGRAFSQVLLLSAGARLDTGPWQDRQPAPGEAGGYRCRKGSCGLRSPPTWTGHPCPWPWTGPAARPAGRHYRRPGKRPPPRYRRRRPAAAPAPGRCLWPEPDGP